MLADWPAAPLSPEKGRRQKGHLGCSGGTPAWGSPVITAVCSGALEPGVPRAPRAPLAAGRAAECCEPPASAS